MTWQQIIKLTFSPLSYFTSYHVTSLYHGTSLKRKQNKVGHHGTFINRCTVWLTALKQVKALNQSLLKSSLLFPEQDYSVREPTAASGNAALPLCFVLLCCCEDLNKLQPKECSSVFCRTVPNSYWLFKKSYALKNTGIPSHVFSYDVGHSTERWRVLLIRICWHHWI